jgi:hypothetical protein
LAAIKAKERGQEIKPEKYYLGENFHEHMADIKANPVEWIQFGPA